MTAEPRPGAQNMIHLAGPALRFLSVTKLQEM
jgi:hypothetical protein